MYTLQWSTYFAPDDDLEATLLATITAAKKSVRIADYSYNLQNLTADLVALHQSGIDVQLVLDKSQAGGSTEKPVIAELRTAGIPIVEGTSEKHKIMHMKYAVIDDTITVSGSYNFTHTAGAESNFMDICNFEDRARSFLANWQEQWDWIAAHEVQP